MEENPSIGKHKKQFNKIKKPIVLDNSLIQLAKIFLIDIVPFFVVEIGFMETRILVTLGGNSKNGFYINMGNKNVAVLYAVYCTNKIFNSLLV